MTCSSMLRRVTVLLIAALVPVVVLVGCGSAAAPRPAPVATQAARTTNSPRLSVTPMEYNFGTVTLQNQPIVGVPGPEVKHVFVVSNVGSGPLTITRIFSGCACTSAPSRRRVLKPGQHFKLPMSIDTGAVEPGRVVKRVFIFSNDPNNPQVPVTMLGFVHVR